VSAVPVSAEAASAVAAEPYDMAAVVHVHSTYSDGATSVPEIVDAAADAEADAVLLTDGDSIQARRDGHEGWHQGVLLLVGVEMPASGARLLEFGIDEGAPPEAGAGIGFSTEPVGAAGGAPHPWSELAHSPVAGIELWSLVSTAAQRCRSPRELSAFISRTDDAMDHPPSRNVAEWDRLCRLRRVVAIGGVDARHDSLPFAGGRVLSPRRNARLFRMLRTHLLCERRPTGDLDPDRGLALAALRSGRCFLGRDSLAGTRGFRYYADGPAGLVPMGGAGTAGQWTLRARLPFEAELRVIKDGVELHRAATSALDMEIHEAGAYRVEARLRALGQMRTWIVSNPIYLRENPS
jgi:hypothetical protein